MDENPFASPRADLPLPPRRGKLSLWQHLGVYVLSAGIAVAFLVLRVGFHRLLWWLGSYVLPGLDASP